MRVIPLTDKVKKMEWLIYAVVMLFTAIVAYDAASQKMPDASQQQPKQPSINEGDAVKVVFGKVIITSPNVSSWGDMEIKDVRKQTKK